MGYTIGLTALYDLPWGLAKGLLLTLRLKANHALAV